LKEGVDMTTEKKNMWGDLTGLEKIKTPTIFLREQADHLWKDTKYTVKGEVSRESTSGGRFRVELDIVAPSINNYRYTVVTVRHPLDVYPLTITNDVTNEEYECKNEKTFLETLEFILSSAQVRKVISMLISQSST